MKQIILKVGKVRMSAELNDSKTAKKIWNVLPINAKVNTWGEEIYFRVPVHIDLENGVNVVQVGDMCYWPDGDAFCVFFGKTPVSTDKKIKPASAVTIIGHVLGNPRDFCAVKAGEQILVEKE